MRVKDVGHAVDGPENLYTQAWDNNKPAVLLVINKQPGANVIETVDLIKQALPRLQAVIPPAVTVDILSDRTATIRASVADVEFTLAITIGLVVLVILLFLRNLRVTVIPSLVVPLSLLGANGCRHYGLESLRGPPLPPPPHVIRRFRQRTSPRLRREPD